MSPRVSFTRFETKRHSNLSIGICKYGLPYKGSAGRVGSLSISTGEPTIEEKQGKK